MADTAETRSPVPEFRLTLRLDFGTGARIGPGKIALLEAVDETGSISAAGRRMNMSYRRAWLLLDALNRMFDEPVVTASAGGARGGGASVTPFGRDLVAAYRALESDASEGSRARLGPFLEKLSGEPEPTGREADIGGIGDD